LIASSIRRQTMLSPSDRPEYEVLITQRLP
jgi:hypothetical protein